MTISRILSVALPYQPKRIYATTSLTGTKLNTRYSSSPRPRKAQGQERLRV